MRVPITFWVGLSALLLGLLGGFYVALYIQGQTQLLAALGVLFAVLTWLGSGSDFLGMLIDWVRRQREEEKIPTLDYRGFFYDSSIHSKTYWVRLEKVKGEGFVKECSGNLIIGTPNASATPTVWEHAGLRIYNIGKQMDLRLFSVHENHSAIGGKAILFPAVDERALVLENPKAFDTYADKLLTISVTASYGHTPSDVTIRISDIIAQAHSKTT